MENEKQENAVEQMPSGDVLETFQIALANMAIVQKNYSRLALFVAELMFIVGNNGDDDAEIGLRVKRLIEDYTHEG